MNRDAGRFYELRMRLRGKLSEQRTKRGLNLTPSQEDAWLLLNEVDALVKLVEDISLYLPLNSHPEVVYRVQHALLMHKPKWHFANREGEITPPAIGALHPPSE